MGKRVPYTVRERRKHSTQDHYGWRPTNNWGLGDLPAPYATGDVVELVESPHDRIERFRLANGFMPRYYVVNACFSVDEGDGWYFRVRTRYYPYSSDRLHVFCEDRCKHDTPINWMSVFELYATSDPEGLAIRERMLADGWSLEHSQL